MPDTHLIVPVDVAALAVGKPDITGAQFLAPMADFSRLPWSAGGQVHNPGPYTSAAALANAQPFQGETSLPSGIHVHWALPDGLTAGAAQPGGVVFPAAPDRWLVTRIVVSSPVNAPVRTSVTSWVVESDALSSTATAPVGLPQPTVALPSAPGTQNFAYLGEAFALADWTERGPSTPRLSPLTAVGYGHPAFAAFYPNCSTVFGYYDGLTDLVGYEPATSAISYHVSGWYSDPTNEPLQQPQATPATYGWSAPDGATPTATVCTGVVDAIDWNPATSYLSDSAAALTVAIGPSTREALSALMTDVLEQTDPGRYADAEQVLNALQFGVLSGSSNEIGALAAFEEAVHTAGFAAFSGGRLWTVTSDPDGNPDGGEAELPDQLAEQLNALNVLQLQCDDKMLDVVALQFQLFADWYKYQIMEHASNEVPPALQGHQQAAQQYLQNIAIPAISAAMQEISGLQASVDSLSAVLNIPLPKSGLVLTKSDGAPRYYRCADPVLVLSGPDVTPTDRYGYDAVDGALACRTDSQIVSSVVLAAGLVPGSTTTTVPAGALPQLAAQPFPLAQALTSEAFFLAAGLQPSVTAAAASEGGAGNPARLDQAETVHALTTAAAQFLGGSTPAGVTFAGFAPAARYFNPWKATPWLPILLQYDAQFAPVQFIDPNVGGVTYAPTFVNDNFAFDSATVDLVYGGALPTQLQSYQGVAILTPNATVDLATEISTFITHTGSDPELQAVLDDLATLPILTQGLTGLTDAFLMRGLTLQMPVSDPLTPPPLVHFVADVNAAVADGNRAAPLPEESFNPLRCGTFSLDRLRLVDVFGRYRDYNSPTTVVAKGLAPPPQLKSAPGVAFLPPRLGQAARLLFRWRAAEDAIVETNSSPATSPVLGWVVPSYLDNALQIHAADGTALGELALSADSTTVLWTPSPGGPHAPGTPIATVFAGHTADLANFALGIYNGGDATFFAPFFEGVRAALTFSLPEQFAETAQQAVLAGQALALARASLALDLAGPAATDESWTGFADLILNDVPPSDAGLSHVQFPVTLGAVDQLDDTLVGYWIAPTSEADFRAFWAPYATDSRGGVAPPTQSTLTLTPVSDSNASTDVVLLLDPRGSVHASTGILPVKTIDIPPAFYASALAALNVVFEVAPVLSGTNLPPQAGVAPMRMVAPKVSSGDWAWVTTSGGTWTVTTLTDAATAQATLDYSPQRASEGWLALTTSDTSTLNSAIQKTDRRSP